LLEKLEIQQKDDPGMFIAKKIHQGRLFHIFWMDSNQQDLYQRYYDVIVLEQLLKANNGILPTVLLSDADTGLDYTWDPKPPSGFPKVSGFGIYESKPFLKPEINSETRNCFGPNYARLGQHYL
ncbi:hypothetical protein RclHR1_24030001, partial [Rhizophagus clarus]